MTLPFDSEVDGSLQHCGSGGGGLCQQHLGFRKGLAISSLNVNGIRGCLDEVKLLLSNLGIHFLALNKTKLNTNSQRSYRRFGVTSSSAMIDNAA